MRKLAFLVAVATIATALKANAGFTPMAGTADGAGFSMETFVSGYTYATDGTLIGHGSVTLQGIAASVDALQISEDFTETRIYTPEGILVGVSQGDLSLEGLPSGLYILSSGNRVEKIFKSR